MGDRLTRRIQQGAIVEIPGRLLGVQMPHDHELRQGVPEGPEPRPGDCRVEEAAVGQLW